MSKNKKTTYPKELKLKAVKMHLEENLGFRTIVRELKIPDKSTVRGWVRNYETLGLAGLEERRGRSKSLLKGRPRKTKMPLEVQITRLKAENEFLKKLLEVERS